MKFKLNILALGLFSLGLASCTDSFLDVESKTESSTGNYYKTESDAYRALVGCYDGWQCTTSSEGVGFYLASEMMADECYGATGVADGRNYQVIDRFDQAQSSSDLNLYETDWKNYYAAVYRCNELISRADGINWTSEATKGTYLGEAHAIRALCYFDMVRLWENIPLLDTPTTDNIAQAAPDEVYRLIISDLKYAAENIPANAYPKAQAASNDGHITKYAAEALLARVYLFYSGYYGKEPADLTKAEALAAVEDVIASEEFDLVEEFKNLWPAASVTWTANADGSYTKTDTYAGRGNVETVLAQKFNYTSDYNGNADGNRWQVMIAPRNLITVPYGQGWGACTVSPKLVNSYQSGDTRAAASIIDYTSEGIADRDNFSLLYNDQREYTGYGIKKYAPLAIWQQADDGTWSEVNEVMGKEIGAGEYQISQYQDFVVVRYSDVLLMAAELGSPNAQAYLDAVRDRAFGGDTGKRVTATKENILKERMYEFAFEGLRYWDLLRQGVDVAAAEIAETRTLLSGGVEDVVTIQGSKITATRGLCQIPYNQINLSNGVLKQNAGW
ncbi:RagB/SusD family nutrient uptake outer membrane protein [Bacteroides fluxus]|uniref:SusD family protein n=1 Tax=Bacteroides fluxus YIT 12057 TaxID=763034 RepID=F3PSS8_9BACE|nr:RagB/SusD family nutrient uptake outer membrane protein [Bacteroides fluxus]EGF57188.1 SusD family protein [Bacteroides fluxus YIT 12057]MDY3790356.1 RagB/SusD family nutrient uptake outer membrane protein [Bacteroides fluxus]